MIYIGVADDLGMTAGGDSDGDKGSAVMSGGGGGFVNSTGVGGGGVSDRDFYMFPRVIRQLWVDLPYSFPFFFYSFFNNVFLLFDQLVENASHF